MTDWCRQKGSLESKHNIYFFFCRNCINLNIMKYYDSSQTLIVMLGMHNCRLGDSDPGIWDDRLSVRESRTLEVIEVSAFWRPSGFLLPESLKLFGDLQFVTTRGCWWLNFDDGDICRMSVPNTITYLISMSPTHFVVNIRHQHWCNPTRLIFLWLSYLSFHFKST